MDNASKLWCVITLAAILAAVLLDPLAHEPRLVAQMRHDSRAGVQVASKSIRSGLRTTSTEAGAIVSRLGRMMGVRK